MVIEYNISNVGHKFTVIILSLWILHRVHRFLMFRQGHRPKAAHAFNLNISLSLSYHFE